MQEIKLGSTKNGNIIAQQMKYANRHGLIAGATGTGKTVTLQALIEKFTESGISVFAADVKGDLSGIAAASSPSGKVLERIESMSSWLNYQAKGQNTCFWDIYGEKGLPLRTTLSEMGPLLLSSLLELNDNQQAILNLVFKIADREELLILDLKDLKAVLTYIKDNQNLLGEDTALYNTQSASALLRKLSNLEAQKADLFFGEPALQLEDLLKPGNDGRGIVHLLDATKLMHEAPKIYATFLLWLLSELFEQLPERGDADKPVFALFFDEAHLLFNDTPKALQDKIEQVVRLIRSKGVGVYFITQSPTDIPDGVLAQLGLKIQHGLRAFTVKEQKALKAVAQGFRPNPKIDTLKSLTELEIGEALVSVLEDKGTPSIVEQVYIAPPESRLGPASDIERVGLIGLSPLKATYEKAFDRESAYELLAARVSQQEAAKKMFDEIQAKQKEAAQQSSATDLFGNVAGNAIKKVAQQQVNKYARQAVRGLMGTILNAVFKK